ncbi:hypothetical protein ACRRTK_002160 [Alexandromys fortis]
MSQGGPYKRVSGGKGKGARRRFRELEESQSPGLVSQGWILLLLLLLPLAWPRPKPPSRHKSVDEKLLGMKEKHVFGDPGCPPPMTNRGRLFWPRSRSFDYLYSAGEMLLQNFPVQATINLYEDSDSEEDGEDKEKNVEEEVNEIGPEGCARAPEATPHKATAHSADPPLTCPN